MIINKLALIFYRPRTLKILIMIYQRALLRELVVTAAAVFVVLLAILVTTQTINLLGRAAEGRIAFDAVFAMIGFWSLGFMPILFNLTIFISVLTVLTRYWRDGEISIWLSTGLSLKSWVGPVLYFTLPLAILILSLCFFVNPWAAQRSKEYSEQLKQREELSAIAPGVFRESPSADRIYFIERFSAADGMAQNIFMQETTDGVVSTVFAKTGRLLINGRGERVLTLNNGRRYTGVAGSANFEVGEFEKFTIVLGASFKPVEVNDARTKSTLALIKSIKSEDKSELSWRISLVCSTFVLAFLSIPLSYFNIRTGHTYNLIVALLIFLIYQNGLTYIRKMIEDDKAGLLSILPVHFLFLFLAYFMIRYRSIPAGPILSTVHKALSWRNRHDID